MSYQTVFFSPNLFYVKLTRLTVSIINDTLQGTHKDKFGRIMKILVWRVPPKPKLRSYFSFSTLNRKENKKTEQMGHHDHNSWSSNGIWRWLANGLKRRLPVVVRKPRHNWPRGWRWNTESTRGRVGEIPTGWRVNKGCRRWVIVPCLGGRS